MKKRLTEERKIAARFCVSDSHDFARRVAPSKSVHCLGGVYIHVPFCKQKCFYCDFPSYAGKERYEEAYVKALIQEIRTEGAKYVETWGPPATIYIGGGTPSVLPNELLERLLENIEETFLSHTVEEHVWKAPLAEGGGPLAAGGVSEVRRNDNHDIYVEDTNRQPSTIQSGRLSNPTFDTPPVPSGQPPLGGGRKIEFTMECNPGTIDEQKLRLMKHHGVNRISFGVQTFHDSLLHRIGRIHTAEQARTAIRDARAVGFQNLSLDLIYGLPGETLAMLQSDIDEALALHPDHISIYGLQLEEGTVFWCQHEMGRLDLPDDATTEAMYDLMTETLPAHGYERYEISNFAKLGFESRHNLGYWQDKPYLGLGAAAHSYLDGVRYENTKDIAAYIDAIEHGTLPRTQEEPATRAIQMEEFAFLALRTAKGIDKAAFAQKFGVPLASIYEDAIMSMQQKGLLEETEESVHLTSLGMKYGNYVFEAFLL
ncbi:MAG: radical SAM family heme chaperone HemW [Selenomonas sp.]|nr:radical SAM family heme chaperone HemW [Selenomonas sp.]